jgi:S-layer family protein
LKLILAAAVLSVAVPISSFATDARLAAAANPNGIAEGVGVEAPDTYGSANTFLTLTAWDAQPIDSTFTYAFTNGVAGGQGISRTNAAGSAWLKIGLQIPNGALVDRVEINYCDTGAATFSPFLVRQAKNGASNYTILTASVGTPGCIVQNLVVTPAVQIDNNANSYNLEFNMGNLTDGSIVFASARVGYKLQISPAPATATFPNDVPTTHPFFRFVEAMAASGLTGGCGAGSFCPDTAVTRGQLSVFLSTALGLHFPN